MSLTERIARATDVLVRLGHLGRSARGTRNEGRRLRPDQVEVRLGLRCALASVFGCMAFVAAGSVFLFDASPAGGLGIPLAAVFTGAAGLAGSALAISSKPTRINRWNRPRVDDLAAAASVPLAGLALLLALAGSPGGVALTVAAGALSVTAALWAFHLAWAGWSLRKVAAASLALAPALLLTALASEGATAGPGSAWAFFVGGPIVLLSGVLSLLAMTATRGADREIVVGASDRLNREMSLVAARRREAERALSAASAHAAAAEREAADARVDRAAAESHLGAAAQYAEEARTIRDRASRAELAASASRAEAAAAVTAIHERALGLDGREGRVFEREQELDYLEAAIFQEEQRLSDELARLERERMTLEHEHENARRDRRDARLALEAAQRKVSEAEAKGGQAASLQVRAKETLTLAEARAAQADDERSRALARVGEELEAGRAELHAEREQLDLERERVDRAEREVMARMEALDTRAAELERLQSVALAKMKEAMREKGQAESLTRKAEADAADAYQREESLARSFAEVEALEARAEAARSETSNAEDRLLAREGRLRELELELSSRERRQLAERRSLTHEREELTALAARLTERENQLFSFERRAGRRGEEQEGEQPALGDPGNAPSVSVTTVGGTHGQEDPPAPEIEPEPWSKPTTGRQSLGNVRLDDLVGGGITPGTSLLVVGPAFCGKEFIALGFIADGLEKAVPTVLVTTVRSPAEVQADLEPMLSPRARKRMSSHIRWVDASGRGHHAKKGKGGVIEVLSPGDLPGIQAAISNHAEELSSKHDAFRFVYLPLTESWRNVEPEAARAFLQHLVASVRIQASGAVFVAESGIHSADDIEVLAGLVRGLIRCREERDGYAMRVQGIPGTRSREWVRYRHTAQGIELGSFELERIR